jgi:hypothetical protein
VDPEKVAVETIVVEKIGRFRIAPVAALPRYFDTVVVDSTITPAVQLQ